LGAVAFGDRDGEFAFSVGVVSDVDEAPVVDDGDGGQVEGDGVGVVGVVVELGQVVGEPPGPPVLAECAEGGRVTLSV
jgi:hypothetical protein